jgi:hypothetical protein
MDGARANDLYPAVAADAFFVCQAATSSKVVTVASKAAGAGPAGASVSADRGGSSKYSSENLED